MTPPTPQLEITENQHYVKLKTYPLYLHGIKPDLIPNGVIKAGCTNLNS